MSSFIISIEISSISISTLYWYRPSVLSEKNNYSLNPSMKIEKIMDLPFPQLDENTPIDPIKSLLHYYQAVLTMKKDKIIGIICKSDLLKLVKS